MARKKSPTKIFNDDDYLDASGNYTQVPAPNPRDAAYIAPEVASEILNTLLNESKSTVENKELELKQIEADKEEARKAKIDALKATREANYFAKQTADKIESASA